MAVSLTVAGCSAGRCMLPAACATARSAQQASNRQLACNTAFLILTPACPLRATSSGLQSVPRAAPEFPSPAHTLVQGGHTPGEGVDFMLQSVTAVLPGMRAESSLLRYLRNLQVTHERC